MRIRLALIATATLAAIVSTAASPAPRDATQDLGAVSVVIMGTPAVIEVPDAVPAQPVLALESGSPPQAPPPTPVEAVALATTPTYAGVIAALHSMTAEQLIRFVFPDNVENKMVAIAKRESGLNCAAKNRHSSATGLFQTLSLHAARAKRLGLSWRDVAGPDCVADVFLAYDIWKDSGLAPWRVG